MGESWRKRFSTTSLIKAVAKTKGINESEINGKIIFEQAKKNDKECIEAINNMVDGLAIGIANVCYIVNPEVVIFREEE